MIEIFEINSHISNMPKKTNIPNETQWELLRLSETHLVIFEVLRGPKCPPCPDDDKNKQLDADVPRPFRLRAHKKTKILWVVRFYVP